MISDLIEKLETCYLPKLSHNLEECESHSEFAKWDKNLADNFPALIDLLNDLNLSECSSPPTVLSSLWLLYLQLHSEGPWKTGKCEECAQKLDYQFQLIYDSSLCNLLKTSKVHDAQEVFEKSMELLHQKLSPGDFKKYPALVEAYCFIMKDLKSYDLSLQPVSVLPVSLLLIEDYVNENRLKGLESCSSILKSLAPEHFKVGNYYEFIYQVLTKVLVERDLEITKLVLACLLDLIIILPPKTKIATVDEILGNVLDQMYTESNLYRKKAFFNFMNKVIPLHGVHCVNKHLLLPVICDNLDICSNDAVEGILLLEVIECLEAWIKYCWCVWKLSQNHKLMSLLIKMLFIVRDKEEIVKRLQNIFIALCRLSSKEEQQEISISITKSIEDLKSMDETFTKSLVQIKNSVS